MRIGTIKTEGGWADAVWYGTGEDITLQLQAFMDYVNSGILSSNPLVQAIDQRVNEVRKSEKARVSYMTYELHLRDAYRAGLAEGKANRNVVNEATDSAEGEARGKAIVFRVWHLLQEKISFPEIALRTDLSLKEVEEIAQEFGIAY